MPILKWLFDRPLLKHSYIFHKFHRRGHPVGCFPTVTAREMSQTTFELLLNIPMASPSFHKLATSVLIPRETFARVVADIRPLCNVAVTALG